MRVYLSDSYIARESSLHCLPSWAKLATAMILVVAVVLQPLGSWIAHLIVGVLLVLALIFSKLPLAKILMRLVLLEPFVVMVAVLSLFQDRGLIVFTTLAVKGTLCLLTMILLVATTRFADILSVLRRTRLPLILVTTIALMYRYLFLIATEMNRLTRARESRTFTRNRRATWRSSANVIGHLFVRTSERAERIYAAMCARGWKT